MIQDPKQVVVVTDPRQFDGDPFDVAGAAVAQAAGLAHVQAAALKTARLMARNAEMERQLLTTGECDAAEFEDSVQARQIDSILSELEEIEKRLRALERAARYNPARA